MTRRRPPPLVPVEVIELGERVELALRASERPERWRPSPVQAPSVYLHTRILAENPTSARSRAALRDFWAYDWQ